MIERNGAVRALDQNVTLVVLQAEQLLALLSHSPGPLQDEAMLMCGGLIQDAKAMWRHIETLRYQGTL